MSHRTHNGQSLPRNEMQWLAVATVVAQRMSAVARAGLPLDQVWWEAGVECDDATSGVGRRRRFSVDDSHAAVAAYVLNERHRTADDAASLVDLAAMVDRQHRFGWHVGRVAGKASGPVRLVAAALVLCRITGAPLASVSDALVQIFCDAQRAESERRTVQMAARTSARLLLALPLVGWVVGVVTRTNSAPNPRLAEQGLLCWSWFAGGLLWALGWWWLRALGRRAASVAEEQPAETNDADTRRGHGPVAPVAATGQLVAAVIAAGCDPVTAQQLVWRVLADVGLRPAAAAQRVLSVVQTAQSSGLPPVALIQSSCALYQQQLQARCLQAAGRLSVFSVLPVGLCLLPAFIVTSVVPFVVTLVLG